MVLHGNFAYGERIMRKAALILGILGGIVAGGLGMKWLGDIGGLSEQQKMTVQLMGQGEDLQAMGVAGLLLIGSLVAGIAGGILAHRGRLQAAGILMLIAGVAPLFFAKQAVLFTSLLIAGGVVALLEHRKMRQQVTV